MKINRKIIEIDEERCDGCGQCVLSCAEGALAIIDGKAKVISDNLCDGLGACLGECPQDALKIIEREAEDFDEAAVEAHLETRKKPEKAASGPGCPSRQIQVFQTRDDDISPASAIPGASLPSELSHWPVQIRLIPPHAPFLKGADLLILADCVAVTYAGLHPEMIKGRTVMMGCPKFDDAEEYLQRFTDIFQTAGVRSIQCVYMEVPCCSALPAIVKKALEASGSRIPLEEVVISTRGKRVDRIV